MNSAAEAIACNCSPGLKWMSLRQSTLSFRVPPWQAQKTTVLCSPFSVQCSPLLMYLGPPSCLSCCSRKWHRSAVKGQNKKKKRKRNWQGLGEPVVKTSLSMQDGAGVSKPKATAHNTTWRRPLFDCSVSPEIVSISPVVHILFTVLLIISHFMLTFQKYAICLYWPA